MVLIGPRNSPQTCALLTALRLASTYLSVHAGTICLNAALENETDPVQHMVGYFTTKVQSINQH